MRRLVVVVAAVAAVGIGVAFIASVAAGGGGHDSSPTALVSDLGERLFGGGGHGRGQCAVMGRAETAVANTLGISLQQLQTELQSGKSVSDIAQAHGMTVDAFKAALVQESKGEMAQAVTAGTITQARADQLSQQLTAVMDTVLSFKLDPGQNLPCTGFRGRGFDGFRGLLPSPAPSPSP